MEAEGHLTTLHCYGFAGTQREIETEALEKHQTQSNVESIKPITDRKDNQPRFANLNSVVRTEQTTIRLHEKIFTASACEDLVNGSVANLEAPLLNLCYLFPERACGSIMSRPLQRMSQTTMNSSPPDKTRALHVGALSLATPQYVILVPSRQRR